MNRNTKRILALLLTLVMVIGIMPAGLVVSAEEANTYYVATTGNDETGDGTEAKPYASIQKAVNAIEDDTVPTTIIVADGAYNVFVPSDSDLLAIGTYGHGLVIDKDNVTIQAADGAKPILYSYMELTEDTDYKVHYHGVTVRIHGNDVTLDGLTVLPAMNATTLKGFSNGVEANALREFVGADAGTDKTLYMHNDSNGGTGAITITNNLTGKTVTGSVTIQNCSIGYATEAGATSYPFCFGAGMNGDYHVKNNTIYGRASMVTHGVPTEGTNELLNNDLYYASFYVNLPVGSEAGLPRIRENRLHSAFQHRAANGPSLVMYYNNNRAFYTPGEASVIAMSNTAYGDFLYGYHLTPSSYLVEGSASSGYPGIAYTTTSGTNYKYHDTTMDTQEELGYYLGKEGDVTLTQNFEITKAGVLPEKILATVTYGDYKITKTDGLELPAPEGYEWNDNRLEKMIIASLLMDNDLNMNIYVSAKCKDAGYTLRITMESMEAGKEARVVVVPAANWKQGTGANAGKWYVTFQGIAATRMTDTFTVELLDAQGALVYTYNDSIRLYADRLAALYGENAEAMRLITAVLNYGAAAQQYKNYKTDNLANANWNWEEPVA